MNTKSLRFRAIAAFCILSIGLLAVYSLALFGSKRVAEDTVINNILQDEASDFFHRYQTDKAASPPVMRSLSAYVGTNGMPLEFRATIDGIEDGMYETEGPGSIPGPLGYNILIQTIPGEERKLYLFYDSNKILNDNECNLDGTAINLIVFVITAIFGIMLSCIIGSIIFKPLRSLTESVKKSSPDNGEHLYPEAERDDEIGLLARNINNSFNRVQSFAEREQQFTRDASHELRTPLSVIKGAADLIPLALTEKNASIDKLLGRIQRSTINMEQIINTFLWLAREDNLSNSGEQCDVAQTVRKVTEDLAFLVEQKRVELIVSVDDDMKLDAPEQVFCIVLTNILTNAISYTGGGSVNVLAKQGKVTVWDTGPGIPDEIMSDITQPHVRGEASNGFGLGLSIVQRLCDRFGWRLTIENRQQAGTVASVEFTPGETSSN